MTRTWRARATSYDAIPYQDAARPARRRELATAYAARITALAGDPGTAFNRFTEALRLWDARDLSDAARPAPDLGILVPHADSLFKKSSTSGADLEAVTALAVLRAAQPRAPAELDKTWTDILAYTNDLAVAESGPGAERSRAIVTLEAVTAVFPAPWASETLAKLYLERQESVVKAIASRSKEGCRRRAPRSGGHPAGVEPRARVRAHAARRRRRAGGGQAGRPVRRRARAEETPRRRPRHLRRRQDLARPDGRLRPRRRRRRRRHRARPLRGGPVRLPKAIDPRKCASELARMSDRVPLAVRWIREARALDPADRDSAEIYARLSIMQLGDLLAAERLEAAGKLVSETDTFYADIGKKLTGKSLETTQADVLLTYGRGLYAQGDVEGAIKAFERARKLEDTPDVTEELATIAFKTGKNVEAQRGFEAAAEAPRATPIETTFDGNRLRRLAGEAAAAAGDRARAEALWKEALASWNETVRASLPPRARAQAFSEMGRVLYALGDTPRPCRRSTPPSTPTPRRAASTATSSPSW
jgi:hypothetical protein